MHPCKNYLQLLLDENDEICAKIPVIFKPLMEPSLRKVFM